MPPTPDERTDENRIARRAASRRFALGIALYGAAVAVQSSILRPDRFPLPVALVIALAPMVPAIWAMGGWLRAMRTFDELQQRVHAHAGLVALGSVAILSFSYGFLEATLDAPRLSMFFVWPTIGAAYAIALLVVRRRWFPDEGTTREP